MFYRTLALMDAGIKPIWVYFAYLVYTFLTSSYFYLNLMQVFDGKPPELKKGEVISLYLILLSQQIYPNSYQNVKKNAKKQRQI